MRQSDERVLIAPAPAALPEDLHIRQCTECTPTRACDTLMAISRRESIRRLYRHGRTDAANREGGR
jgi:hypothetical protein